MESKGRVGKFILAQGQDDMISTLFSTGPYMDMLMDGMFVPVEQEDGSFMWANPARESCSLIQTSKASSHRDLSDFPLKPVT